MVFVPVGHVLSGQLPLTLHLMETPFNALANGADTDQAALVRTA